MTNVKGTAFATRIRWVRLNQGEQGASALQAEVDPALAKILADGAVMSAWYPFPLFIQLNIAIDRLFGDGDLALVRQLGRHGADANLTTVYRLFMRAGTVKWILARAARLWSLHYDSGRMLVRELPGNEVELEIVEFATPHRVHCRAVQGWAERSAELSGGRDVALTEVDCRAGGDERCRFRIVWR